MVVGYEKNGNGSFSIIPKNRTLMAYSDYIGSLRKIFSKIEGWWISMGFYAIFFETQYSKKP